MGIMRLYMAHFLKLRKILRLGTKNIEKCGVMTLHADFVWNILLALDNFKMSRKSHVWINAAGARHFFLISWA
jgi:hypothetical protein